MQYKQGASSSSSSSTSLTHSWKHDVFLSFRGIDTRSGFTYHLYKALEREKVKTFFDDLMLKRGENISSALLHAIEVSRVSVVICSQNYASSSRCLDELVKILQCQKSREQIVIPVFYKVIPAHVRHQSGSFGQAFNELKGNMNNKIPEWRAALTELANLSGLTYVDGYEYEFIEKIVKEILDVVGLDHQNKEKEGTSSLGDQKKDTAEQSWSPASVWRIFKPKRRDEKVEKLHSESNNRQFTFSEVLKFTNNFETIIGKGGSGIVYIGYINETQVAVKMFFSSSVQGTMTQQFQAEVNLLLRIHHRNLISLLGYCIDKSNIGIIYEYMANGNLQQHLSDWTPTILGWEDRLRIAVDAANGLEYLHYGCRPPIIHGDVKSDNILLTENFQAKVSDFGLFINFPTDVVTDDIVTNVAGTPGYIDPEYYITNRLTEKSDTYSFGIVLLEIITGRPAIIRETDESVHISQWVSLLLAKGDIHNIIDPRLERNFSVNFAWKFLEIAMACVSPDSAKRPTMSLVVVELKECFKLVT